MKPESKREVIDLVRRSPVTKKESRRELGLPASTYYRWQRRHRLEGDAGLVDRRPQPGTIWNRLRPEEVETILVVASRARQEPAGDRLLDQRLSGVQRIGVERVPRAETSRAGAGSEARGISRRFGVRGEDHPSERAVAERCQLFLCDGLGLVLPDFRAG